MFDSPDELAAKVRLGEDAVLALKAVRFRGRKIAGPSRDELAGELAAMANTAGGVLVIGVDDKTRQVEGIPVERLEAVEALVREVLNDSIEPPLPAVVVRLELPDGEGGRRAVLKIDVPRGLFVHKGPGGYFHRIGSSKREMKTEELLRLGQQRSQAGIIRFDEQVLPGTTPADLDLERARPFFAPGEPDDVGLRKLLIARDDGETLRCTVGGLLVFGRRPQEALPNARIEAVHYRGLERDTNYQLDARSCDGPLAEQVDAAYSFVAKNMRLAAIKTPARIDLPQFDRRAVFEALVNAVIHRDYSIHGSKVRLFLFEDRLELMSPGALPNSVTLDTLAARQATRNELIVRFLSRVPVGHAGRELRASYVEARGEGVPLIVSRSKEVAGREPLYELFGDELKLTIYGRPAPGAG